MTMQILGKKDGFTMVELMAVALVVGILSALILGIAGAAGKASDTALVKANIQEILKVVDEHDIEFGIYPKFTSGGPIGTSVVDVKDLRWGVTAASQALVNKWVDLDVIDPWGSNYKYKLGTGNKISVGSLGPNGIYSDSGNVADFGENDDITNFK